MARQQKQALIEVSAPAAPAKNLFERVSIHLNANDWNYTADEEKQYFSMGCRVKDATVRIILDVAESEGWERVLVYSCFPVFIPEARRAAVAESVMRMNYGMIFGNIEMDMTDGEVRIRTVVEAFGILGDEMIGRVIGSNLETASKYFAQILAVAFGDESPAKASDLVTHRQVGTLQ